MRGKVTFASALHKGHRITPAYAGKSSRPLRPPECRKDHPRVCGEKQVNTVDTYPPAGSPPRMRGKVREMKTGKTRRGITPAYAGKSSRPLRPPECRKDHPRVCGEKKVSHSRIKRGDRITPAYAGKRLKRSRSTVPPVAIVPLFPSVCNKPVVSDGSPAGRDAPLFLPAENAVPASPAYNLRSL